jgi:hypothetical protein
MLKTIVELRATTADAAAMAAMASEQERQQTRSTLRQSEGQAAGNFKFGTDAVNTLSYYTTEIVAPFSQPELASRLAGDAASLAFQGSRLLLRSYACPSFGVEPTCVFCGSLAQ